MNSRERDKSAGQKPVTGKPYAPEDYPELSPEMRAIFEEDWIASADGRAALKYLAEH